MKFDARTLQILKNFATINQSILFREGSTISTISLSRNVVGRARLAEPVEREFAIYDLNRFLGVLSLFDNPNVNIYDQHLVVSSEDGSRKVNYTFADKSMIYAAPDREVDMSAAEVSFILTPDVLTSVHKALAVLQLPEIAITGDSNSVYIKAIDVKNPTGDTFSFKVGETDKSFQFVFKAENIKLLSAVYDVKLLSKGIGHFKSDDVEYWIVAEQTSRYDG